MRCAFHPGGTINTGGDEQSGVRTCDLRAENHRHVNGVSASLAKLTDDTTMAVDEGGLGKVDRTRRLVTGDRDAQGEFAAARSKMSQ